MESIEKQTISSMHGAVHRELLPSRIKLTETFIQDFDRECLVIESLWLRYSREADLMPAEKRPPPAKSPLFAGEIISKDLFELPLPVENLSAFAYRLKGVLGGLMNDPTSLIDLLISLDVFREVTEHLKLKLKATVNDLLTSPKLSATTISAEAAADEGYVLYMETLGNRLFIYRGRDDDASDIVFKFPRLQ